MNLPHIPPVPLAGFTGFVAGLVLCIPVGPINLTILSEGARRGFAWAALIGAGAVTMETIYCAVAFTGFASFFEKGLVKATMELVSFVFLLWLGLRFLTAKSIEATNRVEERIEERLKPHTAFMIGFVRVMGNPSVLLGWILIAANLISREWVAPTLEGKLACIVGVAVGVGAWFLMLSYLVSYRKKPLSQASLLRLEHGSGIVLLIAALAHGGQIIYQMAHTRLGH
ncbi:MAG: LysE family transporter [Verrucomicrobia bacterium]|nr:LysE family transporter [Verrucomicrobiota bacterium]MBI3869225.1 LysE family transporter [Verrucomicrobiota bacterium]